VVSSAARRSFTNHRTGSKTISGFNARASREDLDGRGAGVSLPRTRDAGEWNTLLHQAGGTAYHSWEWLDWIAPLLSSTFVPLVVSREGRPVGVAPMLLRRHLGMATANLVPFSYLGPVVPGSLVGETTRAVLRWARQHHVLRMELCLHPRLPAPEGAFASGGLTEETVDTFVIDLEGRDEAELFAALSSDARNAVRRSLRKGVSIRTSTAGDLRTVLPQVHQESLGGAASYAPALGAALARNESPLPVRCATAVVDGRAVGVSVTIGGQSAIGWLAAVYRADQHTQANTALVWDAITWAAGRECVQLDMCGAPDDGIAAYKRKFKPRVERHLVGRWEAPGLAVLRRLH
jgi:hypothetical protein